MINAVNYEVDHRQMVGALAGPDGNGPFPGVLICHEGNGLDEFQRQRTQSFADLGFVAFSLDYHGGGVGLTNRAEINDRLGELIEDVERCRTVAQAGLDALLSDPRVDPLRIVVVGYCFGGTMALELARTGAALRAVVALHPGLVTSRSEESVKIVAKLLVCVGADDPFVSVQQRLDFEQEMTDAGVDWQIHLYGGVQHSFTHPRTNMEVVAGLSYDEAADRRSWTAMCNLFDEVLART